MAAPLDPYQRRLILFLSVATFFEGYDFFALAQVLPEIRKDFGIGEFWGGALVAFANVGTILAFVLVRYADRFGRRSVLQITILGYAFFSVVSAAAPNAYVLAVAQFFARMFLIGEWAVAMVMAAEEFPAHRRAFVIGVIQASGSVGAVVCAGLVPILNRTPLGWRATFAISVVPLLLVALARTGVKETRRFAEAGPPKEPPPLFRILQGPYRNRVLELGLAWGLTYSCTHVGVQFFKEYAIEAGWQADEVGRSLTLAAIIALPPTFFVGQFLDRVGRRIGGFILLALCSVGIGAVYSLTDPILVSLSLGLAMFASQACLPVLNTYTAERFPTELRAEGFGWSNNLIGRWGYVAAPLFVGALAGPMGGWGPPVVLTTIGPILAALLLWWRLPETKGQELEETASLELH